MISGEKLRAEQGPSRELLQNHEIKCSSCSPRARQAARGKTDRGDLAALVLAAGKVGRPFWEAERVGDHDRLEVGPWGRELEAPVRAAPGREGLGAVGGEDLDELRAQDASGGATLGQCPDPAQLMRSS